ncbi:MAG TPA: type II secretion system minor pseudopilin GspK [Steroidobacteraceae bacterium]
MRRCGFAAHGKQRGVALIIALVLVALATILATKLSFDGFLELRRTTGVMAAEQALHFGLGAEALAADVLVQDAQTNGGITSLAGPWAQPTQPMPITPDSNPEGEPIGALQGALEDMQGRFNLNSLARLGADGVTEDPLPLAQFQRLLASVGVEERWAGLVRDWIDQDDVVGNPDGAEDAVYTSQTPPYHTGNWPMMSASELMNLPGFGADRYRKIAPYVTALPSANLSINVCTAPALVLESLVEGLSGEWSNNPAVLTTARKTGCFPDLTTFRNVATSFAGPKALAGMGSLIDTKSNYFQLTTHVTLGTTEFTLYSLLYRGQGKISPLLRSFGTT